MSSRALEFLVPGDLRGPTGGYVYDRTIVTGLRALGWRVRVHGLDASFPLPSPDALARAERVLADLPDGASVLVDGLALGAMPQAIASQSRRLKVIALIHMPLAATFGISPAIAARLQGQEQHALALVRHVIVTGAGTERELVSGYGVARSRISVVEPGVWPVALAGRPLKHTGDDTVRMLCVATIQEGKGHELLMDALAPLAQLPWHLRCVGSLSRSPATVRRLLAQLQALRLRERVELMGELPHESMSELYLAADLFVLPTLRESYCLAVAESLAHGVPAVSSCTGAIPRLLAAGAGLLVEPGDRDALRAALARTLQDGALRSSMRAAALAARARLTPWPHVCERMARVLERVCRVGERAQAGVFRGAEL
jgi:glycosyltransferase involved in cell wall biosynthesis